MEADVEKVMQAPVCEHYFEYHMLGGEPVSVGVCRFCRDVNWPDLRMSLDNLLAAATSRAERAEAAIQRVRALHSPKPGWERQWKDPAEALARGWVECAGCEIQPAGAGRYLDACRTLAALDGTDNTGGTDGTR